MELQCQNVISVDCFTETWFLITVGVIAISGTLSLSLLSIFWSRSNPESKSEEFSMRKSYKKFRNKIGNIRATDNYHYKEETTSELKSHQSIITNSKDEQIEKNDPELAKTEADNEEEDYDFYIRNDTYESNQNDDDSFYITNTEYESANPNAK